MTIKEYMSDKVQNFGLFKISESSILDLCDSNSFDSEASASSYSVKDREIAFIRFAPELLLSIDSVSENGFSISRADTVNRIKMYVAAKSKELGIENPLGVSVISNGSKRW